MLEDEDIANNFNLDNNKILWHIRITQFFKSFKLIWAIFLTSYFLGIIFYIFAQYFREKNDDLSDNFFDYYNLDEKTDIEMTVIMTYYAFSTLSTVGLGDFAPRSNAERIFITI